MAALAMPGGGGPDGKRRSPVTLGRAASVGGIALVVWLVWSMMGAQVVSDRPRDMTTTTVILPPPPPPPPPEVKPVEKPPEPTDAPPVDAPVEQPPTPTPAKPSDAAASEPTPGDNALTAREGAGPSNYGLAAGDGSGTRIGGRPGGGSGDAFAAYAQAALVAVRGATQRDRDLAKGRYTVQLMVSVDAEGRITSVQIVDGSNDARRDDRLVRVLTGLQIPRRPPAGLRPIRLELTTRS